MAIRPGGGDAAVTSWRPGRAEQAPPFPVLFRDSLNVRNGRISKNKRPRQDKVQARLPPQG